MTKRRAHSSIDRLPTVLRETLTRMIVNDEWPAGWEGERQGRPHYADAIAYSRKKGFNVSNSSFHRWITRMQRKEAEKEKTDDVVSAIFDGIVEKGRVLRKRLMATVLRKDALGQICFDREMESICIEFEKLHKIAEPFMSDRLFVGAQEKG